MQKDYHSYAKDKLGIDFDDIGLLVTAFTHRSYINEHTKSAKEHNERLEFLGDAVLELAVTEYLYKNFDDPEGKLTNLRSALVRTESIAEAGEALGFNEMLRLSKGERRGSKRARRQIYANTFEAVTGAIYLDQGFDVAREFLKKNILSMLPEIIESGAWEDAKSKLQEIAQEKDNVTPSYKVIKEVGPDHDKRFTVGVYIGKLLKGKGEGTSKQSAQQAAAEKALKKY